MCSAEGSPKDLFDKVVTRADAPRKSDTRSTRVEDADLLVDDELGFAKDRTMSRSESYLCSVTSLFPSCCNLLGDLEFEDLVN